ncbi:uncharacterized protein LOC124673433 [Lolium rigidum]|uniref:uncharacterized protein LOC124673433 n=1 Tax=Lolium rigidum TaxID=89674 RepID=UPI001F5C48A6|nr:uncharacterized protein LOC124673433 [Lolium rigidum]
MAVADALMPPPPLPAPLLSRIVLAPALDLARAAADARPYLCSAIALLLSAGSAAAVVARRVWGEGSAPFVFLEALTSAALKACLCMICLFCAHIGLLLCGHILLFLADIACDFIDLVLDFRKSALWKILRETIQELNISSRTAALGGACLLLFVTGCLVASMSPPVEGSTSQGEKIGSMIIDVGLFGFHAIFCIVIISDFGPSARRKNQSDRRRRLLRQS